MSNKSNEDEDDVFQDAPEYSPKSEFSKPRVVEECLKKCCELRNQEMKPGYFNFKTDKNGLVQKVWIPDARIRFIGAVENLINLLSPEILRDKSFQKKFKEIEKDFQNLWKQYNYKEKDKIWDNQKKKYMYKKTGEEVMPEIDDAVIMEVDNFGSISGQSVIGGWNYKVNTYRNRLVEIYDSLFSLLNELIDRLNYFKASSGF